VIEYCIVGNAVSEVCRDTAVTVVELKLHFSSMSYEAEITYKIEWGIAYISLLTISHDISSV
jgi:hypothetical protein